MKLQPIETAPKDGTHILLYGLHDSDVGIYEDAGGNYMVGFCEGWYIDTYSQEDEYQNITGWPSYPTHWMPLPHLTGE